MDRDRGAVIVEAAVIMPVLVLLCFGVIEYGLAFKDSMVLADATRSGARVASALPRTPGYELTTAGAVRASLLTAVDANGIEYLTIYRADKASGRPADGLGFEGCQTDCWRYRWVGNDWVRDGGSSWDATAQSACGSEAHTDYVGVYVRYTHGFVTSFFDTTMTLTDRTVMRLEPIPASNGAACRP